MYVASVSRNTSSQSDAENVIIQPVSCNDFEEKLKNVWTKLRSYDLKKF